MKRFLTFLLSLSCFILAPNVELGADGSPDSPQSGLRKMRLHLMASESMFATINPTDAVACMNIWVGQVGKARGFEADSKVEIAQSVAQMREGLKQHLVDLLLLDTPDYLALEEAKLVRVLAAATTRGQLSAFPYLLLTNQASGIGQLAELRGKRIGVVSRTKSNMGLVWLETLLAENRLGRAAAFFSQVDIGYRASPCILPLFFGKIDACVVDSENWDSMKELNPQLGQLRAVAHSEPFLEGVIALPAYPHPYENELIDSVLNLHRTPAGEQLCVVFKSGPPTRVVRDQFEPVRVLCNKYRHIVDAPAENPATVAGRHSEGRQ